MNGRQLEQTVTSSPCLKQLFTGVFASDTLPIRVERYPKIYVVNTDVSYRPGEHWVAIFLRDPSYGVFFDSFGRTPGECGTDIKKFMDKHVDRYDHFDVQIQSVNSIYCGLFVLAFLFSYVCMSVSLNRFKQFFYDNLCVNDDVVCSMVHLYFDL